MATSSGRGPPASRGTAKVFTEFESYERFMGRWSRRAAPRLADFAGIRDGERVLDVGTGTGVLAAAVARRFPGARVTGIDPSEAFVAHARESWDPPVTFEVADARSLPFDDDSFDRCVSLFALNFVPDPGRAVAEMRRVTRPGGTLAAAVWDYADGMAMLRAFWDTAVELDPDADSCDEKHMPWCREGELARLWTDSGLCEVEASALTIEQDFAAFEDYWSPFLLGTGPAGAYATGLPGARRTALRDRLCSRVLGDGPDRPFALSSRAWAVRGRVER